MTVTAATTDDRSRWAALVVYSHKLVMRYGARTTLLPALGLIAVALALFTQAPVNGNYVAHVLPVMVLLGIGAGLAFPALMTLAMSDATPSDADRPRRAKDAALQATKPAYGEAR